MATIGLDDHFTKNDRIILTRTFRQNCRDLGIDKHDFVIHVRRVDLGGEHHYARVAYPAPNFFAAEMNCNGFNLFDATSCLGHELVHVRQHLHGDLQDCDGPEGLIWKGKFWPADIVLDKKNYRNLPWEKEAFGLQGKLHLLALRELHRAGLMNHIRPSDSNGLAELTIEELDKALEDQRRRKAA